MSFFFRITARFLQPLAHGRRDGGEPEWPPSPLRLFQAIVAAAAARWNEHLNLEYAVPALQWLGQQSRPAIVATGGSPSENPYRLYVPDNIWDEQGRAWVSGKPLSKEVKLRTEKDVRPTHLSGEAVHYLYPLLPEGCPHLDVLKAAARSVTHLGWGIDMVAADADIITEADAAKLAGHRWRVVPTGGVPLRVPKAGTLDDLMRKHAAFLGRLSNEGFKPVPPLSCFDVVGYHSPTVANLPMPARALAAFEIHRTIDDQEKPEYAGKSKFRPYHPVRDVARVAGMVRCATASVAKRTGWEPADIAARVQGHGEGDSGQSTSDDRLQFLPLPSLTPVGVGRIRRVLVVGPPGCDLAPLRRRLNGEELIDKDSERAVAMLSGIPASDRNLMRFLRPARTWSTVTPVILPGYDDPDGLRAKLKGRNTAEEQKHLLARLDARILALVWKAFHQAGWTADALTGAEVEYRSVGWLCGLDLAKNYDLPPLRFPRYHLRVRFAQPVPGPVAVGAGRYRGVGVFANDE